jgi:hypothetical protein
MKKILFKLAIATLFTIVIVPTWMKASQKAITEPLLNMNKQFQANAENMKKKQATERAEKLAAAQDMQIEKDKLEFSRRNAEIEQNRIANEQKAKFEREFKPRDECKNADLEWDKFVKCTNERQEAKEKFKQSQQVRF